MAGKFFLCLFLIVGCLVSPMIIWAATTPATTAGSGNVLVGGLIFEKDLVGLLCLDSRWQGGEFLAGVAAYSDFIASSSKEFPDLQGKLADLAALQKIGQEKISAVCTSTSHSQAKKAFSDLNNFEKTVQVALREIDQSITKVFQDKMNSLKSKISANQKKQVSSAVAQLKISKQAEMASFAKQLVKTAQDSLAAGLAKMQFPTPKEAVAYASKITSDRQTEIKNQLTASAWQIQSLLRQEAQTKTLQVLGNDSVVLSLIVKDAQKNREAIMAVQQKRASQLKKVKTQALQKRKDLAALILSSQVDSGVGRLREKELSNESLSSPLFMNIQQAVDHLKGIKQNFNQNAQAAVNSGDEKALATAISQAEASYRVLQLTLPDVLLSKGSQQEFCSSTPGLQSQIQPPVARLLLLLEKAAKPFSGKAQSCQKKAEKAGCALFSKAFSEMSVIQQTAQRINNVFTSAPAYCQGMAEGALPIGGGLSLASLKAFSLQLKQQLIDWQTNWPQYKNSF